MNDRIATNKDIQYIIPENLRLPTQTEITELDNCSSGSFTIIRNKDLWLVNDYDIIRHYADELAEIVASRFSLIIQSKVMTVFYGEVGNESLEQMIANLYNGSPVLKASKLFDVEDNMFTINNASLAQNLQELKTEYQNKISELNTLFGVNVLAVSKESGVTESESNGNLSYVKTNLNSYLRPRQKAFELYNALESIGDDKKRIGNKKVCFVQLLNNEPIDVDQDADSVYEYVIEMNIYFEK